MINRLSESLEAESGIGGGQHQEKWGKEARKRGMLMGRAWTAAGRAEASASLPVPIAAGEPAGPGGAADACSGAAVPGCRTER